MVADKFKTVVEETEIPAESRGIFFVVFVLSTVDDDGSCVRLPLRLSLLLL